jgi:hypothetical protein
MPSVSTDNSPHCSQASRRMRFPPKAIAWLLTFYLAHYRGQGSVGTPAAHSAPVISSWD